MVQCDAPKCMVKTLQRVIAKGTVSEELKTAIEELIAALNRRDLRLAYELSGVKTITSGLMTLSHPHPGEDYFREDSDRNKSVLGSSVYSILDGFHFKLAMLVGKMPAGMMEFRAGGVLQKGAIVGDSPTLRLMKKVRASLDRRLDREHGRVPR